MRRIILLCVSVFLLFPAFGQKKDFAYSFYGFVRGDLFYNSRANVAPVDGNFYLYPMPEQLDAYGEDLNATPNGSFYTFTTRLGLDMTGPMVGTARTSAKIETDFGGFSASTTMLRIRQAYVALDWEKSQVLIGQTWHPLTGSVMPDVLNLSTGAPFNPFNRSPMLRYQYKEGGTKLTAAALWQLQYQSVGPIGASEDYLKNSCVPELFVGVDHSTKDGWLMGAGAYLISLKPRTRSYVGDKVYKVNERMTAFSGMAHLKYTGRDFMFAAKTILGSSLDHTAMLGGYAVSSVDGVTGKQEYTPFRHSTTWLNMTYGTKWKAGIFIGYSKNLGTSDPIYSTRQIYGKGYDIDDLKMVNPSLSYNLPHWKMGVEYCISIANYGDVNYDDGKIINTDAITNHRIVGLMVYYF